MPSTVLDLAAARRWAVTSRALLSESREHIDTLNVFPVPDGDTGTNMFLTVDGALEILRGQDDAEGVPIRLDQGLAGLARAMLLSARGNSGVILSQLAQGMAEAVEVVGASANEMSAEVLADAFGRAADLAWAAVSSPVEGTILSVARAAAQGAARVRAQTHERPSSGDDEAAGRRTPAHLVALGALEEAREALARTPEQLPRLARAGVVDAGGAGFVLVLEALASVLSDRPHEGMLASTGSWHVVTSDDGTGGALQGGLGSTACADLIAHDELGGDGDYEVMYLVLDSEPERVERLRARLRAVGSSVLVVGGPDLWRVHVHLDHPSAALDAGSRAGRVEQVRINPLGASTEAVGPGRPGPMALGLVCCAPGPGVAEAFAQAGASVVHSSAGNRASTGQLLHAAREIHAERVAILPNDPDTVLAAQAAAQAGVQEGLDLRVVPTLAVVQGLAGVALWDPDRPDSDVDRLLAEMTEAAAAVCYGSLAMAVSDGFTPVGPCRAGQWLGLVSGDIISVDDDLTAVGYAVLSGLQRAFATERGSSATPEMLTVVAGDAEGGGGIAATVQRWRRELPDLEVHHLTGGQRTFGWLVGLE